jgi:lipopolysaccharide/colanic/teichoic acid biosynthesis glycosyltransferase
MKDEKITKIGKLLRITGLDELPQIWNILKGDLVLVGPRPLTPQDHKKFRDFTLFVKPGITGWWQIHGRIQKTIRKFDLEYIEKKSIWLDLYIIWKTIPLVIFGKHGE